MLDEAARMEYVVLAYTVYKCKEWGFISGEDDMGTHLHEHGHRVIHHGKDRFLKEIEVPC